LYSRYEYYLLKVNCPGLSLYTTTDVVGELHLAGGNLALNGKTLRLRGTVTYAPSYGLVGSPSSRLEVVGKLASPISPGMSTYLISSQGVSGINCRNLTLRFVGGPTGQSLKTLWLYREDAVQLQSPLDLHDTLHLETGILRTSATNLLTVRNPAPTAVLHHTTGWFTVYYGFVSGPLRRYIGIAGGYDFPVGYPNLTTYYVGWDPLQPQALHRRLRLEIQNQTGLDWIQVEFVPPVADVCNGQLNITEADGTPHLQLHPEGYWRVQPNTSTYTIVYDVKAYTWGFAAPPLADNRYAVVKRPDGSTVCSDWTREAGTWPPAGTLGRVIKTDGAGRDTSYAHRLGWTTLSEFAIGITDVPLAQPPALQIQVFAEAPPSRYRIEAYPALQGGRYGLWREKPGKLPELIQVREGPTFWVEETGPAYVWVVWQGPHGIEQHTPRVALPTASHLSPQKTLFLGEERYEIWGLDGRLYKQGIGPTVEELPAGVWLIQTESGQGYRVFIAPY
ncbi:MAG: hypothetical protein D6750_05525, partial [Bacteroidetes bacterium]